MPQPTGSGPQRSSNRPKAPVRATHGATTSRPRAPAVAVAPPRPPRLRPAPGAAPGPVDGGADHSAGSTSDPNETNTGPLLTTMPTAVLAPVKEAHRFALEAVATWADVMGDVVPKFPAASFAPTRADVVERLGLMFEMAEELLASQRKFVSDLVNALAPTG